MQMLGSTRPSREGLQRLPQDDFDENVDDLVLDDDELLFGEEDDDDGDEENEVRRNGNERRGKAQINGREREMLDFDEELTMMNAVWKSSERQVEDDVQVVVSKRNLCVCFILAAILLFAGGMSLGHRLTATFLAPTSNSGKIPTQQPSPNVAPSGIVTGTSRPTSESSEVGSETSEPTTKPSEPVQETPAPTTKPSEPVQEHPIPTVEPTEKPTPVAKTQTGKELVWSQKRDKMIAENRKLAPEPLDAEHQKVWDEKHEQACAKIQKFLRDEGYEQDMSIFKENLSTGNTNNPFGFEIEKVIAQVEKYQQGLIDHYEFESSYNNIAWDTKVYPLPGTPGRESALKAISETFIRKIVNKSPLRIGVMGTSIMSGQDNCWELSFPMTLNRTYNRIFAGVGVKVETKPMGQNGDGPSILPQLWCSHEILGDVDILYTAWQMGTSSTREQYEGFMRMWLSQKGSPALHVSLDGFMNMPSPWKDEKGELHDPLDPYYALGNLGQNTQEILFDRDGIMPWWPNTRYHWGRHGNGRCYLETREGFEGTYKQNWHPGGKGVEMWMDPILYLHLSALKLALETIHGLLEGNNHSEDAIRKLYPNQVPPKQMPKLPDPITVDCKSDDKAPMCLGFYDHGHQARCGTGIGPLYRHENDLRLWVVNDTRKNVYQSLSAEWSWIRAKGPSSMRACLDKAKPEYMKRPECLAHPDIGHAFAGSKDNGMAIFRLPYVDDTGRTVLICMLGDKGKKSEYYKYLKDMAPAVRLDGRNFIVENGGEYEFYDKEYACFVVNRNYRINSQGSYLGVEVKGDKAFKLSTIIVI